MGYNCDGRRGRFSEPRLARSPKIAWSSDFVGLFNLSALSQNFQHFWQLPLSWLEFFEGLDGIAAFIRLIKHEWFQPLTSLSKSSDQVIIPHEFVSGSQDRKASSHSCHSMQQIKQWARSTSSELLKKARILRLLLWDLRIICCWLKTCVAKNWLNWGYRGSSRPLLIRIFCFFHVFEPALVVCSPFGVCYDTSACGQANYSSLYGYIQPVVWMHVHRESTLFMSIYQAPLRCIKRSITIIIPPVLIASTRSARMRGANTSFHLYRTINCFSSPIVTLSSVSLFIHPWRSRLPTWQLQPKHSSSRASSHPSCPARSLPTPPAPALVLALDPPNPSLPTKSRAPVATAK